ncbi:MAG: hypothetical protein II794_04205, partial [Oscillospiraceae bacterium]|nr:hypothetical protein [Oscillospiraceae bacterium]
YMENARGELLSAREEAESAWRAALARKERRAKLQARLSEREKALEALAGEIAQHRSDVSRKETELASLRSEISTRQAALPFPGRRAARDHIDALISQRDSISALISGHENEERAAAEALSKARGQEESLEKALPDRERAEKEAAAALEAALTSSGLVSRAGLDAALAPLGDGDRESRLKALQAECTEYDHNCKAVSQRISELTEQTRDLTYTDMEALEAQLNEAREGRTQAENAHAHRQSLLTNHEAVLNRALSALSSLARTDCAFRRISALADLAVGTAAQGGKLSFERYVMGSIFRAVLEMANRRLDIMSGGRYSLVHTVNAARSNSVAGLEIEVLDASTGRRRGAASLSGGETFQVSLALALGLSDVVQTRSGGMGLDTIFIDEGFGALDGTALDNAITVLRNLTERSRLVGIISHVDKLEESIPQKLRVNKGTQGSTVTSELS